MTFPADGDRRALVRALVAEFAPEELPDFDLMTEAYFASPGAARRARRPRDQPGGALPDPGDPTFTNLMWGVVAGLTTELVVLSVRQGWFRLRRRRRKPVAGPGDPLPELPPGGEAAARERIAHDLRELRGPGPAGSPPVEAVAERFVDRWGRRDWTPPG